MSNFKCISDGETVVVLEKNIDFRSGWKAIFVAKAQVDADWYIAREHRCHREKMLYAALTRVHNGNGDETTEGMIALCDDYVQALLAEQQARMAVGDSSAEVTAA